MGGGGDAAPIRADGARVSMHEAVRKPDEFTPMKAGAVDRRGRIGSWVTMREFEFDVVTTSRVAIRAGEGRAARDALEEALNGATARVVDGPGADLEMVRLRIVGSPAIVSIDGRDPSSDLRRLLQAHRDRTAKPDYD